VSAENYGERTGLIDLENSAHNVVTHVSVPKQMIQWAIYLHRTQKEMAGGEKKIREFDCSPQAIGSEQTK